MKKNLSCLLTLLACITILFSACAKKSLQSKLLQGNATWKYKLDVTFEDIILLNANEGTFIFDNNNTVKEHSNKHNADKLHTYRIIENNSESNKIVFDENVADEINYSINYNNDGSQFWIGTAKNDTSHIQYIMNISK